MRPAPLTGTATIGNVSIRKRFLKDATRTPHGDCNVNPSGIHDINVFDATRTPHGDCNFLSIVENAKSIGCDPHPSRGLQLLHTFDSLL